MPTLTETFVLYQRLGRSDDDAVVINLENKASKFSTLPEADYFLNYYNNNLKNTFINNIKTPMMFWRGHGYIFQLDDLMYDSDTVEYLNEHGLEIYLYENMFFSHDKNYALYKPSEQDTNSTYLRSCYGNFLQVIDSSLSLPLFSPDMDSIQNFVIKNNLKKVRVKTIYYNIEKYLQESYKEVEVSCKDACLPIQVNLINKFYNEENLKDISYKLIFPVWRYDSYRHLLASYIVNKDSSLVSWHYTSSLEILEKNLWFSLDNIKDSTYIDQIRTGCQKLSDHQYHLDAVVENKKTVIDGDRDKWKFPPKYNGYVIENTLDKFYKKTFCVLVGESIFSYPFPTISEKTLIAIKCMNPFVIAGAPHCLEYLKELGFKTFDRWWDESYDQEEDHEKRLIKILEVVDYIDSLPVENLKLIQDEMSEVLNHNYQNFMSINNPI
jgi:hypothetical protein